MIVFLISIIAFFILELFYFKIADHFNIIDKPNQRSSHTKITLRGGGVIFPVAIVVGIIIWQPELYLLAFAVLIIAAISFLDDVMTISNKIRLLIHFTAVAMVLFLCKAPFLDFFESDYLPIFIVSAFIITIGVINAYNFMDGINGITALYSLIVVGSICLIQEYLKIELLYREIYYLILAALLVFGFFNLRKRAKAFSGDVGSISIALLICYLILQLILYTQDFKWILLLGIYGLDAVATICCRIIRKENIFEAHRSHFYQYLANETKLSHAQVSFIYTLLQLILNSALLYTRVDVSIYLFAVIIILYVFLRLKLEGTTRLLRQY